MPQLSFGRLGAYLGGIALAAIAAGALLGAAGYFGEISWVSNDLKEIPREGSFQTGAVPVRFRHPSGLLCRRDHGDDGGLLENPARAKAPFKGPGVAGTPGPFNR